MKFIAAFAPLLLVAAAFAEPRTWTSADGRKIQASLVGREGTSVILMLENGKNATVPLDKLSAEDRALCDILKMDFKGIHFGDEMRVAMKKLPAINEASNPYFSCMRRGDVTLTLGEPSGVTVANVAVSLIGFSFIVPGHHSVEDSDPTPIIAYSKLTEKIKITASKSRFYSAYFSFSRDDYDRMKAALIVKYGEPSKTEDKAVQNKLGATFSSQTCTWDFNGATARLVERDGKVDESGFLITCTALMPRVIGTEKRDAKDL